eukprot:TRINITY_DN57035_c0_g1_i1.p1 TRINITY_DN57035_c0_g1~~TRINITY_DN57035_c0_g1_i1.p1  ORF type:complete len:526 (+),score=139.29 TRINITY_DN57035_c0_g1_i1:101-1678(+)
MDDTKKDAKKPQGQAGGMSGVVKLVVRTFLEQKHYRKLHRILGEHWSGQHSLSAVVRLMEAHGMKVSPEEEQRLAALPEDRMIDSLVSRMPQQSREEYEHFFLQLSFIASTTTRLRAALETGNADVIEEALESAENVGVLPFLVKMAVAQAGAEVKSMGELHEKWLAETDARMAPLLQAQATSMSVQKALAQAKAVIASYHDNAKEKAQAVLFGMLTAGEDALTHTSFIGWRDYAKRMKREQEIREEYQDQLEKAQKKLTDYKEAQLQSVRHVLMSGVEENSRALVGKCFAAMLDEVRQAKFNREHSAEVEVLQKKLQEFSTESAAKAKAVMQKMNEGNIESLRVMTFKAWVESVHLGKQEKEAMAKVDEAQKKVAEFMASQTEGARSVMQRMLQSNDSGLVCSAFQGWKDVLKEERAAAVMEQTMSAKAAQLAGFSNRNKMTALSASTRAASLADSEMLAFCVCLWKRETKVEIVRRRGKDKNERRKKDLIGVKGLFRTFADELESSLKAGTPRIEPPKRGAAH